MVSECMLRDETLDRDLIKPGIAPYRRSANLNKRVALFPIFFFQVYLSASVLTFAFGPWQWQVSNPWRLYSFLLLSQLGLLAGYLQAIKKPPLPASTKFRVPMAITVSLVFNYLWFWKLYWIRSGQDFEIEKFILAVGRGFTDPGQGYDQKIKNYVAIAAAGSSTFQDYISFLLFPLLWIAFPLGIFFWRQLPARLKVALVVWMVLDLLTWVAAGTNKGIADFILLLPCLLVARKPIMLDKIRLRSLMAVGLIAIIGITALITFFSLGIVGRSGGQVMMLYDTQTGIGVDPDYPVLQYLPPELVGPIAAFANYFSQGYYGLSLTLEEPFVFCYGVGNSYFLEGLARHLVDTPILAKTYSARIEASGWNVYGRWSSIYPWIASDLTFPGTILFMFLIGRVFGLVWLDVVFCRNPWAVCLLPLLLIMLFYVPANNQVLGFAPTAMPFWVILVLWLVSRKKRKGILLS